MRRMISERERAPLKNMGFDEATNTVEVGTDLYVDGDLVTGGAIGENISQADFITVDSEKINVSNFSVVKMGKILFLDFDINILQDVPTGSLGLAIKEGFRPSHDHRIVSNISGTIHYLLIQNSTGQFITVATTAADKILHINTFYKIA